MKNGDILFTNLPFLKTDKTTILQAITSEFPFTKRLDIAVGYASKASLEELDRLIHEYGIKYTTLVIGMYYVEGMPEQLYNVAMHFHTKWKEENLGEIRIIKISKYHGKIFLFHRSDTVHAILGSANLSVLKPDASTRMQYEVGTFLEAPDDIESLMAELKGDRCSSCISDIPNMPIIPTLSTMLDGDPNCEHLSQKQVETYLTKLIPEKRFDVEIKCPTEEQLQLDEPPFMGSNINVCYSKPRAGEDMRDFYEVQANLPTDLLRSGLFPKWHPFYVVTDDGYWFKVKNTSGGDVGKQLTAGGAGDRVFGKWLKGRLIAKGLLEEPYSRVEEVRYSHAVTKEMLQRYGRDTLTFIKTTVTAVNDEKLSEEEWDEYKANQEKELEKAKENMIKKGTYTEESFEKIVKKITKNNWFYTQDELDVWYMSFAPGESI